MKNSNDENKEICYEDFSSEFKLVFDEYQIMQTEGNLNYYQCEQFLKEAEKLGYTFEYGLDAEPFDFRLSEYNLEFKDIEINKFFSAKDRFSNVSLYLKVDDFFAINFTRENKTMEFFETDKVKKENNVKIEAV